MSTNASGLSRNIPTDVKRAVRQRCCFGCVNCGASIYEYDHFDPEFAQANQHDPAGITLLCPTCHGLKKKKVLTTEKLRELNTAPAACTAGHSKVQLPYFEGFPSIRLGGGVLISKTLIPFQIDDEPAMILRPPETGSKVARISALIRGIDGDSVLRIMENEWIVEGGVWDFEWVGQRMTVRDASGATVFQLTMFPPNYISIDYLVTNFAGHEIRVNETEAKFDGFQIKDCQFEQWEVGVQLGQRSPSLEARQSGAAVYIK